MAEIYFYLRYIDVDTIKINIQLNCIVTQLNYTC